MFRRIKPHLDSYVGRTFDGPRDDRETIERIAEVCRWYTSRPSGDAESTLSLILYHLCASERFGEDKVIPSPMSMEDMQAHLNAATDEVLRKPVPAHLYGEGR